MTRNFVVDQNIAKFRKLLAMVLDDSQRTTLNELLAEEERKLPAGPDANAEVPRKPS